MRALLPLPLADTPPSLWLAGDVDLTTTSALARQLDAWVSTVDAASDPVLDMTGVTFLDLAGLRQLVRARDRLVALGCAPTLRGTPRCVRRLLELTGRERDFGLTPRSHPAPKERGGTGARLQIVKEVE